MCIFGLILIKLMKDKQVTRNEEELILEELAS